MEDESAKSIGLSNVGVAACQVDPPNPTHRGDIKTVEMNDDAIAEAKSPLRRHGD